MANQHTKKKEQELAPAFGPLDPNRPPQVDPAFGHLLSGRSNEELYAKQAELNKLRAEQGLPRIEFGRSEEEKKTVARAHGEHVKGLSKHHPTLEVALENWGDLENDPLGQSDPLAALKEKFGGPGVALKLISPSVSEHLGSRGYKQVKDSNGDPVKCGKMMLGYMPEKFAQKRRDDARDRANARIRTVNDSMKEEFAKLQMQAKDMGLQLIKPGETGPDQFNQDRAAGISVERIQAD